MSDIDKIWEEKRQHDRFRFVRSYLINTTEWKFDHVIFEKKNLFLFCNILVKRNMPIEVKFKRYSSKAIIPMTVTPCSAGSDLYSAEKGLFILFLKN